MGIYWLYPKAIESSEHVRCRPARSSTYICQRGALSQQPGGSNTSSGVCVSSATLTWFHGGAGWVSKGLVASLNHTTLTASEQCWRTFLMHFWKERYWGGALRNSTGHPKKPIVQPRVLRTWWRVPLESDARGGPGKHSIHLCVGLRPHFHTRRGQRIRIFTIDIWSSGGAPKVTNGIARGRSARPPGSSTGCSVMEEWGARGDWLGGVFLTVALRSPRLLIEVGFFWAGPENELVSSRYWSLDLNHFRRKKHTRRQHMCSAPKQKANMRCTCCSLNTRAVAQSSCCNYRMPMCIGSFFLHSK